MPKRRAFAPAITLVAALLLASCGAPRPSGPIHLTILHTNDIHGKYRDTPATWKDGNPPIGGFANLSAYVERERAKGGRTLLLDGGDLMTGNPICDIEYNGVQGGAMIEFMNRMRYDAMALGNHEFDSGLATLNGLLSLAKFPVLSANVDRPEGGLFTGKSHVVLDVDGLRVGVIGLTTEHLYSVASKSALAGTRVRPAAEAAGAIVAQIDAKTDLIVLVTHIGVDGDKALAREVPGIDVIVGGHSHTRLTEPVVENGVIIVQAGAHGRNLGQLQLTVENDAVTAHTGQLVELWPLEGGMPEIQSLAADFTAQIDREYGQVIGRLATPWRREGAGESNVGNWICDRVREHTGADVAAYNSGGIRKDVKAGPVTRLDVVELLPFENFIATFECTGADLLRLAQKNAEAAVGESSGILQLSGIRYAYAAGSNGAIVSDVSVGGKPVDPAATYTVATVDFVIGNGERYLGFVPQEPQVSSMLASALIMKAITESTTAIDARLDGRITKLPEAATGTGG